MKIRVPGFFKRCSKCRKWKFYSNFHKNKSRADGHDCYCKECSAQKDKKYRLENPEKIKEQYREWSVRNPEKIKERDNRYYAKHCERIKQRVRQWASKNRKTILAKHRQYYQKNIERFRKYSKQYREKNYKVLCKYAQQYYRENHEKFNEYSQRRRHRQRNVHNTLTQKDVAFLLQSQNNCCLCCNESFVIRGVHSQWERNHPKEPCTDHIIPLKQGYGLTLNNAQILCRQCNAIKHTDTVDYRTKELKAKIVQYMQQDLFMIPRERQPEAQ